MISWIWRLRRCHFAVVESFFAPKELVTIYLSGKMVVFQVFVSWFTWKSIQCCWIVSISFMRRCLKTEVTKVYVGLLSTFNEHTRIAWWHIACITYIMLVSISIYIILPPTHGIYCYFLVWTVPSPLPSQFNILSSLYWCLFSMTFTSLKTYNHKIWTIYIFDS